MLRVTNCVKCLYPFLLLPIIVIGKRTIKQVCNEKHGVVDCSYRNLTEIPAIPKDFFFKTLNFNGNILKELSEKVLSEIPKNISSMFFENCNIKSVHEDTFHGFHSLSSLVIGGNVLDEQSIQTIFDQVHTGYLDLSRINFGQFGQRLNVTLSSKLRGLSLNNCNISFIEFIIKTKSKMKLKELDLSGNKLTGKSLNVFDKYSKCYNHLRILDLSSNPIETLSMNTFSRLKDFRRLFLRNVQFQLGSSSFQGLNSSTLRYLDLSGSLTSNLPLNFKQIFSRLPKLYILNLSGSNFSKVTNANFYDMLIPLKTLETLEIADSSLSFIPYQALQKLRNLKVLNLSLNRIIGWKEECFRNQSTKLTKIYLDRNNITLINQTSFPPEVLVRLHKLYLHGNPFSCTCALHWFRNWMRDADNYRKLDVLNKNVNGSYECGTPPNLRHTLVVDFDPNYERCNFPTTIFIAGLIAAVLFVTIVVFMALKKIYLNKTRIGYKKIDDNYLKKNPIN